MELSDPFQETFTAPQVIASGNNVYVAWDSVQIYFSPEIQDAGANFEPVSIGDEAGGNSVKSRPYFFWKRCGISLAKRRWWPMRPH